jgi:RNA recognition motif-containing protein
MNIFVGNLSPNVTEEVLRGEFEAVGQVSSVKIIKDKYSGQSRGFGFVEMPDQTQGQTAIRSLNGKEFLGKALSVSEARSSGEGRSGGPRRSGRPGGRMEENPRKSRY